MQKYGAPHQEIVQLLALETPRLEATLLHSSSHGGLKRRDLQQCTMKIKLSNGVTDNGKAVAAHLAAFDVSASSLSTRPLAPLAGHNPQQLAALTQPTTRISFIEKRKKRQR